MKKTVWALAAALGLAIVAAVILSSPGCGVSQGGFESTWPSMHSPTTDHPGPHPPRTVEPPTEPPSPGDHMPVAPDVKAGWADDNAQFNYYLNYLDRFANTNAHKVDVSGRIIVRVIDNQGRPVANCDVTLELAPGKELARRRTFADGRAMFFPAEYPKLQEKDARQPTWAMVGASLQHGDVVELSESRSFDPRLPQTIELKVSKRELPPKAPLDVVFAIDTTGSMGDEIAKLKQTIEAIHFQVTQMNPKPDARFGMVLYRDHKDEYVTKVEPLTGDIKAFVDALDKVKADGGGDEPEDVQRALADAIGKQPWRPEAVKMVFLLGDAPPHLDYEDEPTYVESMHQAAAKGIKITTIGASGLNQQGEYIWRQIAQYTMGQFVFLTYGEKGETKVDTPSTVSHHTGDNWQSRNFDAIIVQSIARELQYLSDKPIPAAEDYFEARPRGGKESQQVLDELFAGCLRQLVDYSQVRLEAATPTAVVPAIAGEDCPPALAGTLGDRLAVTLSREKTFKTVERENLKHVLDELDLAKALDFDKAVAPKPGALSAKLIVLAKVRKGADTVDMFVKLVRIDTGQVLSASLMKIDKRLVE